MKSDAPDGRYYQARRNDWESDFFRREIWTLTPCAAGGLSISDHLKALPNVRLWECRVPLSSRATIETLISSGFFLCDTNCEFSFDLSDASLGGSGRKAAGVDLYLASPTDIPKLEMLINEAGFETRFARMPFSASEAAKFYCLWVRNAVFGTFDDECAIASSNEEVLGFITLRNNAPGEARIGLLATALGSRRSGVGKLLFCHAASRARQRGICSLRMFTQSTNRGAIALSSRMNGRLAHTRVHMYLPVSA